MEKKIKELFDYQRFEKNGRLEKLISETNARQKKACELSDDALDTVSAAGETDTAAEKKAENTWYGIDPENPGVFPGGSVLPKK